MPITGYQSECNKKSKRIAYLIELKGSDLCQAAKQLEATQKALSVELPPYSVRFRIVGSKCKTQEIESTNFKKYRLRWKHAFMYRTECLEENI